MRAFPFDQLAAWWAKSICSKELILLGENSLDSLKSACNSLATGLSISLIIQFAVMKVMNPNISYLEICGMPLYGLAQLINVAFFVMTLNIAVWFLGSPRRITRAATAASLYALGGQIPIVWAVRVEVFAKALEMFINRSSPNLDYFGAARYLLLYAEPATGAARARSWLFYGAELTVTFYFTLYILPRVLSQVKALRLTFARAWVGALVAHILTYWWSRVLSGRVYWLIMGSLLGSQT